MDITSRLQAVAAPLLDTSGEELRAIGLAATDEIAREAGLSRREVEVAALRERILPVRYVRSVGTVGWEGQAKLLESTVGIVGAGGLGGWIIEGLARMGVGHLIVIDGDAFEENNLNRQALCTETSLGQSKAALARERVALVNAAVEVTAHEVRVDEVQMVELLRGSDVVVDALDALPTRLALQRAAHTLSVPLVHGAIAGFVGQVMTILPGDPGLRALYGEQVPEHGMEAKWGNPAATPMMISAWQVQEVVKLLTGRGQPLIHRLLFLDSESGAVDILQV